MPLCTKRRAVVACTLLAVYLYLHSLAVGGDSIPSEDEMMEQMMSMLPPEECISLHLYDIDETARVMPVPVFCDRKTTRSDVMCRWYLAQQMNVMISFFSEKQSDDICLIADDNFNMATDVPRIVHYVTYGTQTLTFMGYMSILSAYKFIKPWSMYVLSDQKPSGEWWDRVVKDFNVRFVKRDKPAWIGDVKVRHDYHAKNLVALQVLLTNGGIYLDLDMLILRSLDPLLKYNLTIGIHDELALVGTDIILSKRASPFINVWHSGYTGIYNDTDLDKASSRRPYAMWMNSKGRVHGESIRFYNPSNDQKYLLYTSNTVKWTQNLAMRIWRKPDFQYPDSPEDINMMDNTLGQVLRHIYHGNSRLVKG